MAKQQQSADKWDLAGKVAVVTGGSSGIGKALVEVLVKEGARVVIADLTKPAEPKPDSVVFSQCDVTRPEASIYGVWFFDGRSQPLTPDPPNTTDIAAAIAAAKKRWGRFDIMVNNAGISGGQPFAFPLQQSSASWRKVVDINLTAVIEGTQQAIAAMANNENGGVVINVASMAGLLAMPQSPVYAASKAGVVNFTRSMNGLIGQSNGVRVNAICVPNSLPCEGPISPTFTETPLVRENTDEVVEGLKQAIGGRLLAPSDVAQGMVELMVDPKLTGAVMRVTVRGGREILRSSSSQSSKSPATARL